MQDLVGEMNGGGVDALFVMGNANPAFDLPNAAQFAEACSNVGLKVSFSGLMNETTAVCDYIAPAPHYLESWGDVEPKRGHYSLIQPTINPLFDTREVEVSLLSWAGSANLNKNADQPYYEYVKQTWNNIFAAQTNFGSFQSFWDNALHDGVYEVPQASSPIAFSEEVSPAGLSVSQPSMALAWKFLSTKPSIWELVNMRPILG